MNKTKYNVTDEYGRIVEQDVTIEQAKLTIQLDPLLQIDPPLQIDRYQLPKLAVRLAE
jgi:hypothetical protein